MSELVRVINQIDMLVHPDFSSSRAYLADVDPSHLENEIILRSFWTARAIELASHEDAILLYFPVIKETHPDIQLAQLERARQMAYGSILGERFVTFDISMDPPYAFFDFIQRRRVTISPHARMIGYGEYRDYCVADWLYRAAEEFELPSAQVKLIPELSLA